MSTRSKGPMSRAIGKVRLPAWIVSVCLGGVAAVAGEPTRIYLANDDHTDYMWSADDETYDAVFVDMLDYYLRLADETAGNPEPYQSRFNTDGAYWLRQYERRKSAADFERLIARVKDGHVGVPLNTLVSCYGGQPLEAVLRGMYYAGHLERRYGVRFLVATAMENQTLPLGLASLWAGAGARYSYGGICGCASRTDKAAWSRRDHEIYWYAGHDGRRVLMKWHSLAPAGNKRSGGYAEAFDPAAAVEFLRTDSGFLSRYRAPGASEPYRVRAAFGYGWDALDRKTGRPYPADTNGYPRTEHFHTVARELSTSALQVIVSNQEDFFRDFEATHGAQLPAQSVTFGNEWELYSASMAETSARVRRSVEKLRAAELMAALTSLANPAFLHGRESACDEAWLDLGLYWEHDWTADGPVPRDRRAAWAERLAGEIEAYVDALHAQAAAELGARIRRPEAAAPRFFVLNPLGWTRTDSADLAYGGSRDIHVRDLATGLDAPHQFVELEGKKYLRVLASAVPPAGYKVFEILDGPGSAPTDPAAAVGADNAVIENSRVRVAVDADGAIASLVDKTRPEQELAGAIGGAKLNDLAAGDASGDAIRVENGGPVSVTLLCTSRAGGRHTTRITLVRDSPRVEIRNEITENFGDVRHWAFSFNLPSPAVRTEEVGAVIRAARKSEGGDYADANARYDYLTVNHFADIVDGTNSHGVVLANADCAFARLGRSTPAALDTATPQLNVLAGGQVDGAALGIRAQHGASRFLQRFALQAHGAYDAVEAMKVGLEHQNPFVTGAVLGATGSPYPATYYSLIDVGEPAVLLWALKPHEDGIEHGLVARVWNLASEPRTVRLATAFPLAGAARVTHLETPLEPLTVKAGRLETAVPAQALESFVLMPVR